MTLADDAGEFLGFDVADLDLYSHLSGIRILKWTDSKHWCHRINERHLFSSIDDAREFVRAVATIPDSHVQTHLPAVPFGLWRRLDQ